MDVGPVADLSGDLALRGDEQDAVVRRVGNGDGPGLQEVGIVGLVQVAGGRPVAGVSILAEELARRVADLDNGVVVLLVGDDARSVPRRRRRRRESRSRPAGAAWWPTGTARHVAAGVRATSRSLPRSAISSVPAYGAPAPGDPAGPP